MDESSPSDTVSVKNKKPPSGILRIDVTKPRRSSGGSVEFKMQPELLGYNSLGDEVGLFLA